MVQTQVINKKLKNQPIILISIFSETYADGINVRLVASERLSAHALSNIPEFSGGIASTRDE